MIRHRLDTTATATDANSKLNDAAGEPTSPVVSMAGMFVWPVKPIITAGKRGENMTIPGIGGRPLKFQSVEELQSGIDKYFADCDSSGIPYTFTGLALALDSTRETLGDYELKAGYSYPIKQAKERVANYAERSCFTARNPAGAIFLAKNRLYVTNERANSGSLI